MLGAGLGAPRSDCHVALLRGAVPVGGSGDKVSSIAAPPTPGPARLLLQETGALRPPGAGGCPQFLSPGKARWAERGAGAAGTRAGEHRGSTEARRGDALSDGRGSVRGAGMSAALPKVPAGRDRL